MKIRLLIMAAVGVAGLAACATGGTMPTQAPTTASTSASANAREELTLHRQEGRQALEYQVVTQTDGKMVCDPDPKLRLRAATLQMDGTVEFGSSKITTRNEGEHFKIIPPGNDWYPRAKILIVNDKWPVALPHNLSTAYKPETLPVLVLDPKEFGGKIEAAAFCTSEQ